MADFYEKYAPGFSPEALVHQPDPSSPSYQYESILRDEGSRDTLAVAAEQENMLAEQEFAADMEGLTYGEIYFKYGADVANNRAKLDASKRKLSMHRNGSNSTFSKASDVASQAANALYSGVGTVAQGFAYLEGEFDGDPNTSGADVAAKHGRINQDVSRHMTEEFTSDRSQDRSYYRGIADQLDAEDRQVEYEKDIEAGIDPWFAKLRREGSAVVDTAEGYLQDPMTALDDSAQGIGSLYASAPLAMAGGGVAGGLAGAALKNQVAKKVATSIGTAVGAGSLEVGGAFNDGVSAIMDMPLEELMDNPIFQELIREGDTPEDARMHLAGINGETAAVRSIPATIALGFITNKFERMPVGNFMEGGVTRGLLQIAGEGVEEAGQGANQTLAVNTATGSTLDTDVDIAEGLGAAITQGAVAGIGTAGAAATPGATIGTAKTAAQGAVKAAPIVADTAKKAGGAAAKAAGKAADAADPYVKKAAEKAKPATDKFKEKVVAPVSEAVDKVYDHPTVKGRLGQATQARRLEIASNQDTQSATEKDESLSGTILERDDNRIPEKLKDVSSNEQTPIQNTVGAIKKIASKGYTPTDDEILYVANQLTRLKNDTNLPKKTKAEVNRLLRNKEIRKLMAKGVNVDLNEIYDDSTEINDDVITTTANVAKVNPVNTNPVVARKILNMSNNKLSESEIKQIEIAAKLSEALNLRSDNYHAGKTGTDKVSREIQERGISSSKGTKLRSLNQFATDILSGINNAGTFVTEEGRKIPVATLATQLTNLVQHMNNKLEATNTSITNADGNSVQFRTLKDGKEWVEPGQAGASSITIHTGNENSMNLARNIQADTDAANTVLNTLKEAYPEHFKGEEIQSVTIDAEPVAEADTQADSVVDDTSENYDPVKDEKFERVVQVYKNNGIDAAKGVIDYTDDLISKDEARLEKRKIENHGVEKAQKLLNTHRRDNLAAKEALRQLEEEALVNESSPPTAVEEEVFAPAKSSTETKGEEKVTLTGKTQYVEKDQAKSDKATKFIGKGSRKSSTEQYRKDWGDKANTGEYTSDDTVFISSEGNRNGRIKPDLNELQKALDAGAKIVTDSPKDRERPYNVGERDVAAYLLENGYTETSDGVWEKSEVQQVLENVQEQMEEDMTEEDRELKEVLDDSDNWPDADRERVLELSKVAKKKVRALLSEIMGPNIVKRIQQIQIFPDSIAPNEQGFAYEDGSVIYLNEQLFDENGNLTPFGETVAVHEAGHITDYTNVDDTVGPVYVTAQNTFYEKGAVYKEMRNLWKRGGRVRDRINYAVSYLKEKPSQTAAEFFAVATEFYFGPDRESLFADAPVTLALMEEHYGKRETARSLQRLEETTSEQDTSQDNEEGEGSETSGEINSEVNPDFDASKGKDFTSIFRDKSEERQSPVRSLKEFLELAKNSAINPYLLEQIEGLIPGIVEELNARLQLLKPTTVNGKKMSVQEAHKQGLLHNFPLYRPLMLVDAETMSYDQRLVELAALAGIDWLLSARGSDPRLLEQTLKRLGLDESDITVENRDAIATGMDPDVEAQRISQMMKDFWGVEDVPNISLEDSHAITEGLAKEILTIFAEGFFEKDGRETLNNNFIEFTTIEKPKFDEKGEPIYLTNKKDENGNAAQATTTLPVMVLRDITHTMQESNTDHSEEGQPDSATEFVFGEKLSAAPSFGENTHKVKSEQRNGTPHSEKEMQAMGNLQNTPHFRSDGRATILNVLEPVMFRLLGGRDDAADIQNDVLRVSVEGKNTSIRLNLQELKQVFKGAVDGTIGVFYPAYVTATGRIGIQGPNYQNNKVLRGAVTNTWAEYDLKKKSHMNFYWLAVAQGVGLKVDGQKVKLEKGNHRKIVKKVKQEFASQYGELKDMMKDMLQGKEVDPEVFFQKSGVLEPAQIYAIAAVAELEIAQKTRGQKTIRSPLSAEIDGLTNGAANMMVNFGQGELTLEDYENLQRIGFFIGAKHGSVNEIFQKGWRDLYETTSDKSQASLYDAIENETNPWKKKRFKAIMQFAAAFGNFEYAPNEIDIQMTRDTSKNPMTKVNYGAASRAVGVGIANDMILKFYEKLEGMTYEEMKTVYPEIEEDIETLFGTTLKDIKADFTFSQGAIKNFHDNTTNTIGDILTETTKGIIGDKITNVNDILVFSTNIQSRYVQLKFEAELLERAEQHAKTQDHLGADNPLRNKKTGKAIVGKLPVREYNQILKDLKVFAPILTSQDQTLDLGGISKQRSEFLRLSRNLTGKLQTQTVIGSPSEAGVKVIPFGVIGTGDALMMLEIFSGENYPKDAMDIFDGFDVPALKLMEYAQIANAAVLRTWDRDVLGMGVQNYKSFLNQVDKNDPLLKQAFDEISEMPQQKNLVEHVQFPEDLLSGLIEAHRQNQARKSVFKRIPLIVDQMGGSGIGFRRRKGTLGLSNINREIKKELNIKPKVKEADSYTELFEGNVGSTIKVLSNVLRGDARKVLEVMKKRIDPDVKIVFGSLEQVNEYRDNLMGEDSDGEVINAAAAYDGVNNIIFVVKKDPEAILHELVHLGTFEAIYDHYNGNESEAVQRLEDLMNEFLSLSLPQNSVQQTKAEIQLHLKDQSANGKASALNEFMAYTLANGETRQHAKDTRTRTLAKLSKKVLNILRSIIGVVPRDMWSHVFANTSLLKNVQPHDPSIDGNDTDIVEDEDVYVSDDDVDIDSDDAGGTPPPDEPNQLTPVFDRFTNYWINLLKKRVEQARAGDTKLKGRLFDYGNKAKDVVTALKNSGFAFSDREERVFRAIHAVMSIELQLEPRSLLALQRAFEHVQTNLSPSSFGTGPLADERYEAVMAAMGGTESNGATDAVPVLLALSQTNQVFRDALETLDAPSTATPGSASLTEHLTTVGVFLMQKVIGHVADGKAPKYVLDDLAKTIIQHDNEREYAVLRRLTSTLTKADNFVSGKLSDLAQSQGNRNVEVSRSNRSDLLKTLVHAMTAATDFLDTGRSAQLAKGAKQLTHMGVPLDGALTPIREFVNEVIGTTDTNKPLMALLDKTNDAVSAVRQVFREHLPQILEANFTTAPNPEQWKLMFHGFGKTGFAGIFGGQNIQSVMNIFSENAARAQRIADAEAGLSTYLTPAKVADVIEEAKQLANFMNGGGPGKFLMKNAYAIARRKTPYTREPSESLIQNIDELVTLYAIDAMTPDARGEVSRMYDEEANGVRGLLIYMHELHKNEEAKIKTPEARINAFKGYIPNLGSDNTQIIIAEDADSDILKEKGYTKLRAYEGDPTGSVPKSYYITNIRQQGQYNQGVMQNVQNTYSGVDATKGYTVTGDTSGSITGEDAEALIVEMNDPDYEVNDQEGLIPFLNKKGEIIFFEQSVSRQMQDEHLNREENLAQMIGAWAGRQAEEKAATAYNKQLIDSLKEIWDNRDLAETNMFIDLSDSDLKDPVYRESYLLIPQEIKDYADQVFGNQFMVRKDMINLSVGYRVPSVVDLWSGKTRMPETLRKASVIGLRSLMGDKAYKWLSRAEETTQGVVSSAKDIIVVRSLVVPAMNAQANYLQLANRGVPLKMINRGIREKLAEVEAYHENIHRITQLKHEKILARNNVSKQEQIERKIQSLEAATKRMSIAPMIEAGQYKNLSEGITQMDVAITSGKITDYLEKEIEKLPDGLKTAMDVGLVSKSTKIYKIANRAVQYGDFIAKSIYYDHLIEQGLSTEEAISAINQEFVNFSVPPGRSRDYMESLGATWFLAFKVRIAKIAMNMMREQPVRTMIAQGVIDVGDSPFDDNLFSVIADDRFGYALGWDMLFGSPTLIPWVNLMDG